MTCDTPSEQWGDKHTQAWETMRQALCNATLMHHPDPQRPYHVYTDASIRAIGGVLIQEYEAEHRPIAFAARKLTPAERNYTTTDQEHLAVVFCFRQWRCYLKGARVFLHTDHEPLTWLQTQKQLNRRQSRWVEVLADIDHTGNKRC